MAFYSMGLKLFPVARPAGSGAVARAVFRSAARDTGINDQVLIRSLEACRQFLQGELPNGPFRLFHQSFRDFLLIGN